MYLHGAIMRNTPKGISYFKCFLYDELYYDECVQAYGSL